MLAKLLPAEHPDFTPEQRAALLSAWGAWWEPLRDRLVAESPPRVGSFQEVSAIEEFAHGAAGMVRKLAPDFQTLIGSGFEEALLELIDREKLAGSAKRKLALRYLESALTTLVGFLAEVRATEELESELTNQADEPPPTALDPGGRAILGLELAAFVALDLALDASFTDEQVYDWSKYARLLEERAKPWILALQRTPPGSIASDIVLSSAEFRRVQKLVDEPPRAPLALRELLHGD